MAREAYTADADAALRELAQAGYTTTGWALAESRQGYVRVRRTDGRATIEWDVAESHPWTASSDDDRNGHSMTLGGAVDALRWLGYRI